MAFQTYSLDEGAAAIRRSRSACAVSRVLNIHRIALSVAGHERRRARVLCGGSNGDVSAVRDILTNASVCADCIEGKTGLTLPDFLLVLARIGTGSAGRGQCGHCSREGVITYRIG